jgi:hypothetical protein
LGSLTGFYSRFYSCPRKVAVTFGCAYLLTLYMKKEQRFGPFKNLKINKFHLIFFTLASVVTNLPSSLQHDPY